MMRRISTRNRFINTSTLSECISRVARPIQLNGHSISHRKNSSASGPSMRNTPHNRIDYITAPIYYVNAEPHLGHLYTTTLVDAIQKWLKLKGRQTLSSVGTDEHGLKVQEAALKRGMTPQAHCDEISPRFQNLFEKAGLECDDYIRTTEPRHHKAVAHFWKTIQNNGYIYKGHYEGWYCISDETFLPETQVVLSETSKTKAKSLDGKDVEWTREENYKFALSEFKEPLLNWLKSSQVILPERQHLDVVRMIETTQTVTDISVSRLASRLQWGIPVPNDPAHVIYVWLDALVNYLTVTGYPWTEEVHQKSLSAGWPAKFHIVGQDIIKFHAIYWPAFLMAAKLPLPEHIVSHGHWLKDRTKMSKSLGNVVDPFDLLQTYGADGTRYFLLREGGISHNPEFSEKELRSRYRNDLAGQLGNMLLRSSSIKVNPMQKIPLLDVNELDDQAKSRLEPLYSLSENVSQLYDQVRFNDGVELIFQRIREMNRFLQERQPWKLIKEKDNQESQKRHRVTLAVAFEHLRICGILLQPIIPDASAKLLDMISVPLNERQLSFANVGQGWKKSSQDVPLQRTEALFSPLDQKSKL